MIVQWKAANKRKTCNKNKQRWLMHKATSIIEPRSKRLKKKNNFILFEKDFKEKEVK